MLSSGPPGPEAADWSNSFYSDSSLCLLAYQRACSNSRIWLAWSLLRAVCFLSFSFKEVTVYWSWDPDEDWVNCSLSWVFSLVICACFESCLSMCFWSLPISFSLAIRSCWRASTSAWKAGPIFSLSTNLSLLSVFFSGTLATKDSYDSETASDFFSW